MRHLKTSGDVCKNDNHYMYITFHYMKTSWKTSKIVYCQAMIMAILVTLEQPKAIERHENTEK